jgi:hypothetical protein
MVFETFLSERNDRIDNAAADLLDALCADNVPDGFFMDQHFLSQVIEATKNVLKREGFHVCHPAYIGEYEIPCFTCNSCDNINCFYILKGVKKEENKNV